MLKPDSLRAALTEVFPDFATDPDRLRIFIDKGRIVSRLTTARGFEYRYRLNLILLDFTHHPDALFLTVCDWLRIHQPDLVLNQDQDDTRLVFEAELLDTRAHDISIELQLREAVRLVPRPGGGHDLVHLPEPPIDEMLGGVTPDIRLRQIWRDGERLLPDPIDALPAGDG